MGSDPIHKAAQHLESSPRGGLTPVLRLVAGGALAWCIGAAAVAPELPAFCAPAALVILATTLWRPRWGLALTTALAPAGALFAAAPVRAAELFAWAFLAGWLLRVWRPLSASRWPRAVMLPAVLYAATLAASWLALTIGESAGIDPIAWPQFLAHSIPQDHLLFSSPEPETWTLLQSLTGIAVFLAAVAIARDDRRLVRALAGGLAICGAILAVATLADVARQWAEVDYSLWFLRRYVDGERFSLHLADVNAAASLYVLAGLAAVSLAATDQRRRWGWIGLIVPMLPALVLAGSLSAIVAAAVVAAATMGPTARVRRWQPTKMQLATVAAIIVLAVAVSALLASRRGDGRATASEALLMRSQFLETSARMFASAPILGVGIGRYFDRSAEFMPGSLREMYGNENAHNYFAQQFAELGLVGGLLFIWLVGSLLASGWRRVRSSATGQGALLGLFAGTSAYLLTSLTGHPLLVPEAALPFWAALGAVGGASTEVEGTALRTGARTPHAAVAALVVAVLSIGVGRAVVRSAQTQRPPPERGFHGFETDSQEQRFRWMTRHAVAYIPAMRGIVTLHLRGPEDRPLVRPLIVETAIAGRIVDRREIRGGAWVTVNIGVREPASAPFRRIDLRANQQWTQDVRLGIRTAQRPISAMVGEIGWTPVDPIR